MSTDHDSLFTAISSLEGAILSRVASDLEIQYGDDRLGWDRATKMFDIMASDFRWRPSQTVSIRNPRTGGVAEYRNPRAARDRENDIQYWELKGPHSTTLRIYND